MFVCVWPQMTQDLVGYPYMFCGVQCLYNLSMEVITILVHVCKLLVWKSMPIWISACKNIHKHKMRYTTRACLRRSHPYLLQGNCQRALQVIQVFGNSLWVTLTKSLTTCIWVYFSGGRGGGGGLSSLWWFLIWTTKWVFKSELSSGCHILPRQTEITEKAAWTHERYC